MSEFKIMLIKIIMIILIFQISAALTEETEQNENLIQPLNRDLINLHRVKRGLGTFFGVLNSKSSAKTTPNNYLQANTYPSYGYSGDPTNHNSYYLNNNYRESNLYYLFVSLISFGVIVYCCHQCKTNRNLEDEYRFRELARMRSNDESFNNVNNNLNNNMNINQQNLTDEQHTNNSTIFKPTAPLPIPLVQQSNYPPYPVYTDDDKPPSYLEAIAAAEQADLSRK